MIFNSVAAHAPYPWDMWPRDGERSQCGYVGLQNLGATCYMASSIQQLFMMPEARASVLAARVYNLSINLIRRK